MTIEVAEAWALLGRGDLHGALAFSRRAHLADPDDGGALCCLALARWHLGLGEGPVLDDLRRSARLAPDDAAIQQNLATVLAAEGWMDEAATAYRRALQLQPADARAFYGLSQALRFTREEACVRQMAALVEAGALPAQAREFACFGLAKAYDDLDQPEPAMRYCLEANQLANRVYDAERARTELGELRRMVAADAFRRAAPSTFVPEWTPLFIVGMPRAGTTLVETILSRHPKVRAGGESSRLPDIERALRDRHARGREAGSHRLLCQLPAELFTAAARTMSARLQAGAGTGAFAVFTDKLPDNSQRLGLIARLFPTARIVHVRRHPLDCGLSNLFQRFSQGNGFAFRQDLLGERLLQVEETMALWKTGLDLPIFDLWYEELVADPEKVIGSLLGFVGLAWEEACLRPELSRRRITTAGSYSVRQPIGDRSVGRWRRYEPWLQPLVAALGGFDAVEPARRG